MEQEQTPATKEQLLENLKKVGFAKENPTTDDFIEFLGADFQQLAQTARSGWFAYTNSTLGQGITTRAGGETPWLALANVVWARFLEKNMSKPE